MLVPPKKLKTISEEWKVFEPPICSASKLQIKENSVFVSIFSYPANEGCYIPNEKLRRIVDAVAKIPNSGAVVETDLYNYT